MSTVDHIELEAMPAALRELLAPRVRRLGYLGDFFAVAAHQPDALAGFVAFTEALKRALPLRTVEVIALTVAARTANAYERVQHERLALREGMPVAELRALVEQRVVEHPGFSAVERAAAALATDVVDARGGAAGDGFTRIAALEGPAYAVACLMTAVRYLAHATMANTWGLTPPIDSPLEAGADA